MEHLIKSMLNTLLQKSVVTYIVISTLERNLSQGVKEGKKTYKCIQSEGPSKLLERNLIIRSTETQKQSPEGRAVGTEAQQSNEASEG